MVVDDLTQFKACHADEIEVGDVLVNLGEVWGVHHAGDAVLIEWYGAYNRMLGLRPTLGKTFPSDRELVRWAREHEIEHDFDHNTDHGGEG